jgi:hypothetical protein
MNPNIEPTEDYVKKIDAYLIHAQASSVDIAEFDLDPSRFGTQLNAFLQCDVVESLALPNGDVIWFDDEGMQPFKNTQHFFWLVGSRTMVAGDGLVTGLEADGRTICAPKSTRDEIRRQLMFLSRSDVEEISQGRVPNSGE